MIQKHVQSVVENALQTLSLPSEGVIVERPADASHGHYATNAMLRAGEPEKAEALAEEIAKNKEVEKAEAESGFVNIFLTNEAWHKELVRMFELRETYAHLSLGGEQTVNIEFISANPTGELHVGNGRGAFFGDVLANVLEKTGYVVEREYYVNDARSSLQIQELGKTALGKGEAYKTPYLDAITAECADKLAGVRDESEAGAIVAQRILTDIQSFVSETLGIRIDRWFSENDLVEEGKLESVKEKMETYEKDGALWAKTTACGDDEDRVLVRSDGAPGYFLSDIAYHLNKASRADVLVDIWGADHQGHVKRMYAAGKALGFADALQVLISQIVHVKEAGEARKMSKRRGETVPLAELVDMVGVDAARFFFLSKALSTHMDFDVALAREQSQKNPVYYVQYSYARTHQIFKKAKDRAEIENADLSLLVEPEELALIRKCAEYPEIIAQIVLGYERTNSYDLHKLTTYAHELAATFHTLYEAHKILVDDPAVQNARLALVRAYQIILKDVLATLGIQAPERM